MSIDPLSRFSGLHLRTFSEWEDGIAKTIPTMEMLDWFGEVLDAHAAVGKGNLNLYLAAQARFRELAHFSRKLTPVQRQALIGQADMIIGLVRDLWGKDSEMMARIDVALAASADRFSKFGWPNPVWDVVDFEEL